MTTSAQELFAQARELPAAERDAFLSRACGGNAELHLEVQRLLVDAERAPSFFGDVWAGMDTKQVLCPKP